MRLLIAGIVACALVLTLGGAPAAAASSPGCRVTNKDTGRTYTRLQTAVNAAKRRHRLVVRGTCHGGTVIDRGLVIEGVKSRRRGKPVLDGGGKVRPLTIKPKARVTIRSLTIRGGHDKTRRALAYFGSGGGILNRGQLKLRDVVVRNNRADATGGGIYNEGILRLRDVILLRNGADLGGGIFNDFGRVRLLGATRITKNGAREGGGAFNRGWFSLHDSSSISVNRAKTGGGVSNLELPLTLNDSSSIRGNTAYGWRLGGGGGVQNVQGSVTLNDSSSIRGNTASTVGGGVNDGTSVWDYLSGSITLNDASSITGNRAQAEGSCCEPGCGGPRSRAGGVNIARGATLTMTGSSVIADNHAVCFVGGVSSSGAVDGVVCGPEGNVRGNSPADCRLK